MPDVFDIPSPASPAPGSAAASEAHSSPVALPFTPSIEKEKQVLNDLACGDYSFVDIAQNHDTNVEALSAWMATDEVEQRLAMIESGPARQARLVATIRMPDAVRALTAALDNLRFEEEHAVTDRRNQRIRELRRRGADTLRKIVALLHRITRFHPLPEGGGRGKGSLRDTASSPHRAPACSPSPTTCSSTSSAGRHARLETPSAPSDPCDPTDPSANPPASLTPESLAELRALLVTLQSQPEGRSPESDPTPSQPVKRAADECQMRQHLESDLTDRPSPVKRANETLRDRQRLPDEKMAVEVAHAMSKPAEITDDPLLSRDPPDATAPP